MNRMSAAKLVASVSVVNVSGRARVQAPGGFFLWGGGGGLSLHRALRGYRYGSRGCSTVVLICITCPAITVGTVILWALDRVRGRALGLLGS